MKILVISDTHGKIDKVFDIWGKLKDIDLIIHCGDGWEDGKFLEKYLSTAVVGVSGNCDSPHGLDQVIETPYGKILITHGHKYGVSYDLVKLSYRAEELGCFACCYGHTHMPIFTEDMGITFINPGSLSQPRDGTNGSYVILTITEDEFHGAIVYYDSLFPNKKSASQGSSGRIKVMLNYSDRF